jgi:hypothetical protein
MDLAFQKLKDAIGSEKVKTDEEVLASYASDPAPVYHKPGCVVLPESKEDVKAILKVANEYKIPVTPEMRGVNLAGYTLSVGGGILMDMRRMNKIIEINTDSGYAVIEAGVNFDKLTTALLKVGYRLAIPTAPGGSAVLGNALSRPTNSMCSKNMDAVMDLKWSFRRHPFHTGSAISSCRQPMRSVRSVWLAFHLRYAYGGVFSGACSEFIPLMRQTVIGCLTPMRFVIC